MEKDTKMLFEKKEITLKNGKKAILRAPRREDGAEMCEYLRTMSSETEFVIRYPEECTETAESEGEFLEKLNSSELKMMIVCEVDGKIAGNCQIMFYGRNQDRAQSNSSYRTDARILGNSE